MKTIQSLTLTALLLSVVALTGCKTHEATATAGVKPYPLDKCVVSNEAFEHGKPYVFVYNGQEVKLCCKDCMADFSKDPKKYMAKIDAAK